jgi:predicted enzyme related to lactoylglutathione lyase
MVHVADWRAGLEWYRLAFAGAIESPSHSDDRGLLEYQGIAIEIVPADEKVVAGPAGCVVYWAVENFDASLQYFLSIGARLYRGPIDIENDMAMCQVRDPWDNCIGLRGRRIR